MTDNMTDKNMNNGNNTNHSDTSTMNDDHMQDVGTDTGTKGGQAEYQDTDQMTEKDQSDRSRDAG